MMNIKDHEKACSITFFDKKSGSGAKWSVTEELTQELQKPGIKKLKRKNAYARFKDIICADSRLNWNGIVVFQNLKC